MNVNVQKILSKYFSKYPKRYLRKNEILIEPDSKVDYIYFLNYGLVKSYAINSDGNEFIINILKPTTFFPITPALIQQNNRYYFETITPSIVHKAPTEKVLTFLEENNEVLMDLTKRLSSGLEGTLVRIQYLTRSDASTKVSSSLILLLKRFGESYKNNYVKINIPLTHQDIANLAGISRETASIELKKLEREGIISRKGKYTTINDSDKLQERSILYFEEKPLPYGF